MYAPRIAALVAAAALGGALLSPLAGAGQANSILSRLEPQGRLTLGAEARGALSASDIVSAREQYLDVWSLEGRVGEHVVIDLMSDDFDAYLYVVGPGLPETLMDDDSGTGCDARIAFTFLENGTFLVVASSDGTREAGVYTLRVSDAPARRPYACGGVDPERLASLPVDGRTLILDQPEFGLLTQGATSIAPDRPAEAWALEGRAGENARITLSSTDFDAYLYVIGPGIDEPLQDDDGGGMRDASLDVRFPADGTYTVIATVLSSGSGGYTLMVTEPRTLEDLATEGRMISVGETVHGTLTAADPVVENGRHAQAWALEGRAGQRVSIELLSGDFDSYLYLVGPGLSTPVTDDDGAGDLDARIEHTFREDGTYKIVASALGGGVTGAFTLIVSER